MYFYEGAPGQACLAEGVPARLMSSPRSDMTATSALKDMEGTPLPEMW
jgi:hypothetical protein